MHVLRISSWFSVVLALLCYLAGPSSAETLKVGVAGSLPFVQVKGEAVDGISVRIWKSLAEIEKLKYEYRVFGHVEEALSALQRGEIDVLIGPISITSERATHVTFTQPYFRSGLGILSHEREIGFGQKIRSFFSGAFFLGVLFLVALLAIVGALIWLCERGRNTEQFPPGVSGFANGMWLAVVTMTTVGYGDKAPITVPGRILTGIWMVLATISFSTLTAGIATALTLSSLNSGEISSPEALRGRRVAVVTGTTSAKAIRNFGSTELNCRNLDDAVKRLRSSSVDAVVFDHPALNHYLQLHPEEKLRLAHSTFETQNYGFALPLKSQRLREFNVTLLKLAEEGQLKEIEDRWLAQTAVE